ncbi:unnamed protein product, partial [Ixodes hexagonus]
KPEQLRSRCSQFKARARRLPTPLLMDSLKRCARRLYARTRLRTPSLASDNTWASSASRRRRRRRIKKPPAVRLDGKAVLLGAPPARRPGRKPEVTARLWLKFFELQSDARKKGLRNERLLADFRDDLKTEHMWNLAKQRASVLWLVSKAHNNRVPPELRDPFYRDHEDQDRLKPQIAQALASAELYCLALANIYADPNYHSLSHQGVVGALQRKGVDLEPPEDRTPLTETVLTQTAPLRMSAHMAVMNGIMELYIKEVLIPIKV